MLKIGEAEIQAVARVIRRGELFRYGSGRSLDATECASFERELAQKMGSKHALVVTSGTAALICGLAGLGVGPGDEVIVPGYTFMATALAPLALGAVPVIAEIDESLTLDVKDAEAKISKRTRAIIPVHMMGLPANMGAVMRVARRHGVSVVEDACQADGGWYKGRRLGTIGDVGAYSFNFYKNITSGEGGALVTDDPVLHERALIFHDGGAAFRTHASQVGVPFFAGLNFRMSEILAAVLRVQLRRIDSLLRRTRCHRDRLADGLSKHPALRLIKHHDYDGGCATQLGLLFPAEEEARAFAARLREQGVGAVIPMDTDRHIYTNWQPVVERRGSYHPALDAFKRPENAGAQMNCTPDTCPRTLDILSRVVFLEIRPEWTAGEVRRRMRACLRAADNTRAVDG